MSERTPASHPPGPRLGRTRSSPGIPCLPNTLVQASAHSALRRLLRPAPLPRNPDDTLMGSGAAFSEARPTHVPHLPWPAASPPALLPYSSPEEPLGSYPTSSKRTWPSPPIRRPRLHAGTPGSHPTGPLGLLSSGISAGTTLPPRARCLRAARAPVRMASRPNSRFLSHFGVNRTRRSPTPPPRRHAAPTPTPGPQSRGPAGTWPGRAGDERAPLRRSPGSPAPLRAPFQAAQTRRPALGTARRAGESSVALNPKSRTGFSSRDLRGRIHITHNSLSFLSPPTVQDGECRWCQPCWLSDPGSIRCHPSRGVIAQGSLHGPAREEPSGASPRGTGAT